MYYVLAVSTCLPAISAAGKGRACMPVGRAFDRVSLPVSGQRSSSGNSASGNLLCLWFLFSNHTFAVRANGEAIFLL